MISVQINIMSRNSSVTVLGFKSLERSLLSSNFLFRSSNIVFEFKIHLNIDNQLLLKSLKDFTPADQ